MTRARTLIEIFAEERKTMAVDRVAEALEKQRRAAERKYLREMAPRVLCVTSHSRPHCFTCGREATEAEALPVDGEPYLYELPTWRDTPVTGTKTTMLQCAECQTAIPL